MAFIAVAIPFGLTAQETQKKPDDKLKINIKKEIDDLYSDHALVYTTPHAIDSLLSSADLNAKIRQHKIILASGNQYIKRSGKIKKYISNQKISVKRIDVWVNRNPHNDFKKLYIINY